jgi:hypothetical protein
MEMYEVLSRERNVGGKIIPTWQREIVNCNILEVEVGTNGYHGGDSGHGCRTYLRISDLASTDIEVTPLFDRCGSGGVEITLGGDTELETFIEALEFAAMVLKKESNRGDAYA